MVVQHCEFTKCHWIVHFKISLCYVNFTSVSSVAQSCLTLCNPINRSTPSFPVLSSTPGVYPNSCPLSRWCHPTISSSVVPFSSCSQSLPASGSFHLTKKIFLPHWKKNSMDKKQGKISRTSSKHRISEQDIKSTKH